MKITRNGINFELTEQELTDAYAEKELYYMSEDVKHVLEEEGIETEELSEDDVENAAQLAIRYRDNSDNYGEAIWTAVKQAIKDSKLDTLETREEKINKIVKHFYRHLRFGHRVRSLYTEEEYKLVENRLKVKGKTKAVKTKDYSRYLELLSKKKNGNMSEDEKIELERMIVPIRYTDIEPADVVRFIDPQYNTLFKVKNLGKILMDGRELRVAYVDDYHFSFCTEGSDPYGCLHICEFAELVEKNGIKLEPVKKDVVEEAV